MNIQAADTPLVTIAIPNYNMAAYIGDAMESALAQTFADYEVLVVDNVSTDNSREIISGWAARDPRVVALNFDTHVHQLWNWNRCLEHARGQYIVFLHADDRLNPGFLAAALELFALRPDLGYVFAEKELIDHHGQVIGRDQFYENSAIIPGLSEARVNFIGWHTAPVQMLIRTECMRAIGGYETSDVIAALMLNLNWDVGYLHTPLVQYRQHQQDSTSRYIKDKMLVMAMYLSKMLVLNFRLPPEAAHLAELKGQIMERTAMSCLSAYAMEVLGRNEKRLCREYLALARGFWLEVDQTPLYRFMEKALEQDHWTGQSLREAWSEARPAAASSGPPYPLPEGSVVFTSTAAP